jgi:hypothetical protein
MVAQLDANCTLKNMAALFLGNDLAKRKKEKPRLRLFCRGFHKIRY